MITREEWILLIPFQSWLKIWSDVYTLTDLLLSIALVVIVILVCILHLASSVLVQASYVVLTSWWRCGLKCLICVGLCSNDMFDYIQSLQFFLISVMAMSCLIIFNHFNFVFGVCVSVGLVFDIGVMTIVLKNYVELGKS